MKVRHNERKAEVDPSQLFRFRPDVEVKKTLRRYHFRLQRVWEDEAGKTVGFFVPIAREDGSSLSMSIIERNRGSFPVDLFEEGITL